ncbi:sugar phosphate isomerase/epimerase [Pullulanibacillus pueri]|uniref:Sugar phosphate isomerase n=1 Tax=Pullulanibacillus pueri TaxID=1437324 RepID=A0A8J3EMR4_9BACL|nr:sugar phosphate isomerase/epimerase [Pullulanibacillus pueri]MBM7682887.1 sugar phosphate isomerase/epimerase [Pullulanibacillus pueri]GGH84392.1 sugar phosphate isomerase [Pullulanibacillus pueri]
MANIPVGLQMFTLREETEKDFVKTLEKVAQLGYQGVEFAGYGDLSAKELKNILDQLGLKAASSHVPIDQLESNLSEVIAYQQTIGSKHVVCPFLFPDRRTEADYKQLVKSLNQIGETCKKEGLTFSYHNHDFELETLSDGRSALQTLLEDTNPEWVKAEFDIYWLTRAGENPLEWIKRYPNRTPLVHLKDMTTDDERFFAELGTGGVDLKSVTDYGEAAGVEWWIVEQDQSRRSPLESIEISINYLKQQHIL